MIRSWIGLTLLVVGATCPSHQATAYAAEGTRRWYVGGTLSYLEVTDSIRSNAAIVESQALGDDGIPGTGDPGEQNGCGGNIAFNQTVFCDPRPDDQVGREYGIDGGFRFDLVAGMVLTRHFSLQVDVGRRAGTIDPIDLYLHKAYPVLDPFGTPLPHLADYSSTTQYATGELTQTTVSLTGIARFRPGSSLRPFVGAGFGRVLYDLSVSEGVERVNSLLASQRIRAIGNEYGVDITGPQDNLNNQAAGRVPFVNPLTLTVKDGYEWHLNGGLEYIINDRLSLSLEMRYSFVDQELRMDFNGEDQIDVLIWPPDMFRPDGSLMFYFEGQNALHPWCIDSGYNAYGCWNVDKLKTRVDPTGDRAPGPADPSLPRPGVPSCPASGDFNDDGKMDVCLATGMTSPMGIVGPKGIYVAQGGTISLNWFSISMGLHVKF